MRAFMVIALISFGAGCSQVKSESGKPAENHVRYTCADGEEVAVVYQVGGDHATLIRAGKSVELRRQAVASGILYSNGTASVRGKGNDMQFQVVGMDPVACKAK